MATASKPTQPSAAQVKADKRRKGFIRAIIILIGIAVVLGTIGAVVPSELSIPFIAVAYFAGFAAVMTLLYSFWHSIIALPGQKEFDKKVESGEIVPEQPTPKKKKRSNDA